MPLFNRLAAEFFGTMWLVIGGCGSAVLAAAFPGLGIGFAGVSLAFGLTVLTMAYAIGHVSGCHLNPAVSVGLVVGGRFKAKDLLPYIVAQVAGAVVAAGVLYLIASGKTGFDLQGGFASNGYGEHSPGGYSLTDRRAGAVGLCADCHWPGTDADPPDQHPGHQHLGEPGAQHRPGALCRRLGAVATVVVLDRAIARRRHGGRRVPPGQR